MSLGTAGMSVALSVLTLLGTIQYDVNEIANRTEEQQIVRLSEHRLYSSGEIRLIAHRGLSALAPENTLPAIQLAGKHGYFGCEFDVYPTSDGVWVVNHDRDVSAMTDGTGDITNYTYAELMKLTVDAGSNVENYPGLTLCTLEEALDACQTYHMYPVIEIKDGSAEEIGELVQMLKDQNLDGHCYVISYDLDILQYVRASTSKTVLFYLVGSINQENMQAAASLRNAGLDFCCYADGNSAEEIQLARAASLPLLAWGTNNTETIEWLYLQGVFAIATDNVVP